MPVTVRSSLGQLSPMPVLPGEMVRELMVEAVERRFGDDVTSHPVKWLLGNGSCLHGSGNSGHQTELDYCWTWRTSGRRGGVSEFCVKSPE